MNLLRKIQYNQYWNIGFSEQTPEEMICDKRLKSVKWLKHPYRDRWFADPFILRVTDEEIVVFVEECRMETHKGIISELVIDRQSMELKNRFVLLEKDTHLSYPAIIRHDGRIFVYPENGASGQLNIYEYDEANNSLSNPICILKESVADAMIIHNCNGYYLTATKYPNTLERLYLYYSKSLFGPYCQIEEYPLQDCRSFSRNGGNYFSCRGDLYRVAQNCSDRYGGSLSIMRVDKTNMKSECFEFELSPFKGRFNLGLHTLNFECGTCVIDGYGYYMRYLGQLYFSLRKLIGKK